MSTVAPPAPPIASPVSTLSQEYDITGDIPFPTDPQSPKNPPAPAAPSLVPPAPKTPAAATVPVVEPTPQAPSSPSSAPRIPAWLLAKATEQGVHQVLIDRLDAESLTQYVMDNMTRQIAARAETSRAATIAEPTPNPAAVPGLVAAAATSSVPQVPAFDWGTMEDEDAMGKKVTVKLTDDDLHPALVKLAKDHQAVIAAQAARLEKLEAFIGTLGNQAQAAHERTLTEKFDDAFGKFPTIFGKGGGEAVKGKPEFERRRLVYGMVKNIPPEQRANLTIEQAVSWAVKTVYGIDAPAAAATAAPAGGDWNAGIVARPTQRHDGQPNGEARAIAKVEEYQRQNLANGTPLGGDTSLDEFMS